jgi:DNA-binding NarL/FixJ family response regulator
VGSTGESGVAEVSPGGVTADPPRGIRLGAVDDHPLLLEGIAAVLEREAPDVVLAGLAPTVDALLARGETFDVVLLDLRLGDGSSPAANTARLRAAGAQVLVHTEGGRPVQAYAAVAHGALGVLLKNEPVDVLVDAVRQAAQGGAVVSREMVQALEVAPDLEHLLSAQELQVLRLYAADLPAKSVARRLQVREGTVKEYLKRIRSKLATRDVHATTKLELRDVAEAMGLLDDAPARRLDD